MTHNEDWAACAASVDPELMEAAFAELAADLAAVCRRRDVRANGLLYLRGLLMPQVAGNCWSIAEAVGLHRPHRLHHLLERACWDEDAARDAVRAFLARHLGTDGGVLIFDETGQAKKGTATAAVGRQYSGTMGRVENVIVAVYTTYATDRGHALIDRDLYVQEDWFADPARMAAAGFPPDHAFATKPALAVAQAKRALCAGISPGWAAGDEVYGRSAALREFLEAAGIGYVFAVPVDHQLTTSGQVRMRGPGTAPGRAARVEPPLVRSGRERPGLLRLGVDRHRPPAPLVADPPFHQRSERTCVLLRLRARAPCPAR